MPLPSTEKFLSSGMGTNPNHQLSKDGSSTLFSTQFGQYYHNPNGAISESTYLFFEQSGISSLLDTNPESLAIFEVGFGTGLNFLLMLDLYLKNQCNFPLNFYSVEAFPISEKVSSELNYNTLLENDQLKDVLPNIFREVKQGKNTFFPITGKNIQLNLFNSLFEKIDSIDKKFDFIFHDAFSPDVNPELWTPEVFLRLASFSNPDVVLTTYCASSKARAAMAKAGWFLAKAQGALGKREMTIASLEDGKLSSYKRINEKRLIERWDNKEFKTT